jgi:hypothetical protein
MALAAGWEVGAGVVDRRVPRSVLWLPSAATGRTPWALAKSSAR